MIQREQTSTHAQQQRYVFCFFTPVLFVNTAALTGKRSLMLWIIHESLFIVSQRRNGVTTYRERERSLVLSHSWRKCDFFSESHFSKKLLTRKWLNRTMSELRDGWREIDFRAQLGYGKSLIKCWLLYCSLLYSFNI